MCVLEAELLMLRAPVGLQICGVARAGQLRGHGRDRTSGRANQDAGLWIFCSRGRRFFYLKAEYLFSKGPPQKGDSLGAGTGGIGAEGGGRRAARDTFLSPQDRVIAVAAGGNTHEEVRMELSSIKVAVTVTLDAVFRLTVTVPPVLLSTVTGYAPLPEGPPEPLCAGAVSRQVSPFVWDREIRDADGPGKVGSLLAAAQDTMYFGHGNEGVSFLIRHYVEIICLLDRQTASLLAQANRHVADRPENAVRLTRGAASMSWPYSP